MNADITLTTFTPAEVERITGLSTVAQRDWRRRDFLPTTTGHARLDMFAVAEVWVLKMLADRGVGPQLGKQISVTCANGIVYHALHWLGACEGAYQGAVFSQQSSSPPIVIDSSRTSRLERLEALSPNWSSGFAWLASQVFADRNFDGFDVLKSWFVWWADNSHELVVDLEDAVREQIQDDRLAGPIIILDLTALGEILVKRAEKPLLSVALPAVLTD